MWYGDTSKFLQRHQLWLRCGAHPSKEFFHTTEKKEDLTMPLRGNVSIDRGSVIVLGSRVNSERLRGESVVMIIHQASLSAALIGVE